LKLTDSDGCFACGANNPKGLHLSFRTIGDEHVTEFVPTAEYQGFTGIVHGGILATLLDEAMGRYLWQEGHHAVTAELKVSLHRPAYIGQRLRVAGRICEVRGRRILCTARAERDDGTLVASAEAKFLRVAERA
jgi:uncharacterized protein (TIGR00369 family)